MRTPVRPGRLSRFLEPGPAELDDRQQALARTVEGHERWDARVLPARQGLDHSIERFEGHGRPVIDRQNHVVFTKCGLGFVGRATRPDTAHAHALAARPLEFLGCPASQVGGRHADERQLADARIDALPFGRGDAKDLLGAGT
jgi:hypothetical protein